jgi:MFS transporter, AAHS family, 3-hydroxyphenylpropionic acid transporter
MRKGLVMVTHGNKVRAGLLHPGLLFLAILIGLFEGADLGSMGLTLSRLSRLLHLTPAQAGFCASASLIGLVLGATAGGRLADLHGRRRIVVISVILMGAFSVATTISWNFESLLIIRFLSGLGMGGLFPILIAMAKDSAAAGFRATAISILLASGPAGAIIVGFISLAQDWRWVFYFGGVGPLLALPAIFILVKAGRTRTSDAAELTLNISTKQVLFGDGRAKGTLLIWLISFCTILASYVMLNWLPSLLILQGFSQQQSHVAAIVYSFGGIFGNVAVGLLMDRGFARSAYMITYIGVAACIAGLSAVAVLPVMYPLAFGASFFLLGAQLVTFALTSRFYPAAARTTGIGAMVSAGRLGSVVGPLLAGALLSLGLSATTVFLSLIPGFAIALVLALVFAGRLRNHRKVPDLAGEPALQAAA